MGAITTHVLDTSRGRPADGVAVRLDLLDEAVGFQPVGQGVTDADGRARGLVPEGAPLAAGDYRLTFETAAYFRRLGVAAFYPLVQVTFTVRDPREHHHVPLLLSPFGFSTYRGS